MINYKCGRENNEIITASDKKQQQNIKLTKIVDYIRERKCIEIEERTRKRVVKKKV